jgi:hypothetical protein
MICGILSLRVNGRSSNSYSYRAGHDRCVVSSFGRPIEAVVPTASERALGPHAFLPEGPSILSPGSLFRWRQNRRVALGPHCGSRAASIALSSSQPKCCFNHVRRGTQRHVRAGTNSTGAKRGIEPPDPWNHR